MNDAQDLIRRIHTDNRVVFSKVFSDAATGAKLVLLDDGEVYVVKPEEMDMVGEYLNNRKARLSAISRNLRIKQKENDREIRSLRSAIETQKKEQGLDEQR